MIKEINWNGFLKRCVEEYPNEACAFLYSDRPYSDDEKLYVFPIKNISKNPGEGWQPDKKEMAKIKRMAREKGLVKIGNVHSHPYPRELSFNEDILKEIILPSKTDLSYAQRFNDVVRGIIVVDNKAVYEIRFHDMFGNETLDWDQR